MASMACADLAASDGRPNAYLQSLASMGNSGKSPGNISTELRNFVERQMPVMPVLQTQIPLH
eukprot:3432123-Lingulodinium_polyedra.AAC.1